MIYNSDDLHYKSHLLVYRMEYHFSNSGPVSSESISTGGKVMMGVVRVCGSLFWRSWYPITR